MNVINSSKGRTNVSIIVIRPHERMTGMLRCVRHETFERDAYRVWSNLATWDGPWPARRPLSDGQVKVLCASEFPLCLLVERRDDFPHDLVGEFVSRSARKTCDPCEFVDLVRVSEHAHQLGPIIRLFDAHPDRVAEAFARLTSPTSKNFEE